MARKPRKKAAPKSLPEVVAVSFFRFTNDQWRQIEKYSDLPSEARGEVEACIGLFRHYQAVIAARPEQTILRKEINDLHKSAVRLLENLKGLSPWAEALLWPPDEPLADWTDPRLEPIKPPRLEAAISTVEQFVRWFKSATYRVAKKRGPKPQSVVQLVGELDEILAKHTGKHINRSYKSTAALYVKTVCNIADPTLGAGTIDNAMKHCISRRGKIRRKIPT